METQSTERELQPPLREVPPTEKNLRTHPRETQVIEMLCKEAVGTDEAGIKKISDSIQEIAKILHLTLVRDTAVHESEMYGLSAYAPAIDKNGDSAATHYYAWDYKEGDHTPFVSIDISTPHPMEDSVRDEVIRSTVEMLDGIPESVVYKTSNDPDSTTWREIAPQIIRQRIAIDGKAGLPISAQMLTNYMNELCQALNMVQLSEPLTIETGDKITTWVHWETSGAHATYDKKSREFTTDIYTCKSFDPEKALAFTEQKLRLEKTSAKNY